jgi:hypothetical protein
VEQTNSDSNDSDERGDELEDADEAAPEGGDGSEEEDIMSWPHPKPGEEAWATRLGTLENRVETSYKMLYGDNIAVMQKMSLDPVFSYLLCVFLSLPVCFLSSPLCLSSSTLPPSVRFCMDGPAV